jgi:hypothetical protein
MSHICTLCYAEHTQAAATDPCYRHAVYGRLYMYTEWEMLYQHYFKTLLWNVPLEGCKQSCTDWN